MLASITTQKDIEKFDYVDSDSDKIKNIVVKMELMNDLKNEYFQKYQDIKNKFIKFIGIKDEKVNLLKNMILIK